MAVDRGKNELQEGLEVIESTNLKYFTKDMTAEFYALKGRAIYYCHMIKPFFHRLAYNRNIFAMLFFRYF